MTNEEFIDIIDKYQANDYFHEFTCLRGHTLKGAVYNDEVIFECAECEWFQVIDDDMKHLMMYAYDKNPMEDLLNNG